MRWTKVVALAAAGTAAVSLAACGGGNPAAKSSASSSSAASSAGGSSSSSSSSTKGPPATAGFEPDAKGPAPAVSGAKKGGTLTIESAGGPTTLDPGNNYYQDTTAILNLVTRALTEFKTLPSGKSVLVPDLATNLGVQSKDGMTWTFHLKPGIKYENGQLITAADIVYGLERSMDTKDFPSGLTYLQAYLKGGATYKGVYASGAKFAGLSAPNKSTVVFHLRKKWQTLPYFAAFSEAGPVPKAKDTKTNYTDHPLATGPYMFKSYNQGTSLTLVKNPYWQASTDPARHQYPNQIQFKWGGDPDATQQAILASNGPDATSLDWDGVQSSIYAKATGANKSQVVSGTSPCVIYVNMDTRKIPLAVRKAIAVAYPYNQVRQAGGFTPLQGIPATSISPPQVPGYTKFSVPYLTGQGTGNPAKAKAMLKAAGKMNFKLSWYYSSDVQTSVHASIARADALKKAGFSVKPLGVSSKVIRTDIANIKAPANMLQGPAGWCYDWPDGDSIFPPTFSSAAVAQGVSTGNLSSKALDAQMDAITQLPLAQQATKWSALDKEILTKYLPILPDYYNVASYVFGKQVHNVVNDSNHGEPDLAGIWVG